METSEIQSKVVEIIGRYAKDKEALADLKTVLKKVA